MAPKDEVPSHRLDPMALKQSEQSEQTSPRVVMEEDFEENGHMDLQSNWKQKVLRTLREWWKDEAFLDKKWTAAGTAIVILAAVAAYYQRRQGNHNNHQRVIAGAQPTTSGGTRTNKKHKEKSSSSMTTKSQRQYWLLSFLWKFLSNSPQRKTIENVSLGMLRLAARQGLVTKAMVGSDEILYQEGEGNSVWKRAQLPPNSPGLQRDLLELLSQHGCHHVSALPESLWERLTGPLLVALPFVYLAFVYKIFHSIHNGNNGDMKQTLLQDNIDTRFSHVAGLEPIMPEVQELVYYLRHSHSYQALGAKPPRGILLHGPPGGGKTLLARAVAGEANAAFLSCSGSEFVEMYVGRGAARVRALFAQAKRQALQRSRRQQTWWNRLWNISSSTASVPPPPPTAIIFIDEFDALAKSRGYGGLHGNDERESTLNQLLTEMDGFTTQEEVTIILIAATNRVDVLDPAILRRLDRQIHVSYPDAKGRRDIFCVHARSTNCHLQDIDWDMLASDAWTAQCSGSDLRNVVNDAALLAVRQGSAQVQQKHFEQAILRTQAMKSQADIHGRGQPLRFLHTIPSSNH